MASDLGLHCLQPGRVAQSVGHLTRKSEVLGSIPGRKSEVLGSIPGVGGRVVRLCWVNFQGRGVLQFRLQ